MSDTIEDGEKIRDRQEADAALSIFRAGQDLGLEFGLLAEEQAFADADLAAGTDQAFPIVGLGESWRVSRTSMRPWRNSRAAGLCGLTACARAPWRRP